MPNRHDVASTCLHACLGAFALIDGTCDCLPSFKRMHDGVRPSCDNLAYEAVPLVDASLSNSRPFMLVPNAWTTTSLDLESLKEIGTELYHLARPVDSLPRFTYIDSKAIMRGSGRDATTADGASVRVFVPMYVEYPTLTVERRSGAANVSDVILADRLGR